MQGKKTSPPPVWRVPSGLCECGCGRHTKIAKATRPEWGQYNGYPVRYLRGHSQKGRRANGWKGGRVLANNGYWIVFRPDHPNCYKSGYIREHRVIWEEHNGRLLNRDEDVHHIDGDKQNNDPRNLVALTKRQHFSLHADSEETCKRKSEFQTARYKDPAERAKTSAAMREWWKRRKAARAT